jgi:hypothetical protein
MHFPAGITRPACHNLMSDLTELLGAVDEGDPKAAAQLLPWFTMNCAGWRRPESPGSDRDRRCRRPRWCTKRGCGWRGRTPVPAGGSTSFTVGFAPVTAGFHTATLRIASNDSDENPFDIVLTGNGRLITDEIDVISFRVFGPDCRDVEFTFGTVPGADYRILKSPSMAPGTWTDAGVFIAGTGFEQSVLLRNIGLVRRQFFRLVKL